MKCKSMALLSLVTALTLLLGLVPMFAFSASGPADTVILFTNDTRGYTEDLSFLSSMKEKYKKNALLVNSGNFTVGSAEASFSNAKYAAYCFGYADFDVVSMGTDDFAYGYRAMSRIPEYAETSFLSGNVRYSGASVFGDSVIKKVGNYKIGFYSLIDSYCSEYIPTARSDGYDFFDEIEYAAKQEKALKSSCDYVVCLASFFGGESDFTLNKLCSSLGNTDAVICSGLGKELNTTNNGILTLSAAERLESIGKITVTSSGLSCSILPKNIDGATGNDVQKAAGTYRLYGEDLQYNDERSKQISLLNETLGAKVCSNKTNVYGVTDEVNISLLEETPLGDVFADALTLAGDKVKADNSDFKKLRTAAFVNGTAFNNNLPAGEINLQNIFETENFAEPVYFYKVNTDFIYKMLEQSVSKLGFSESTGFVYGTNAKFLQISGFNIVVDPSKATGNRIIKMYVTEDEKEILFKRGDANSFLLAVPESLARGRTGYDDFQKLKPVHIGDFMTNYVRTFIAGNISEDYFLTSGIDCRISFKRINELQPNGDAWVTADDVFENYSAAEIMLDGVINYDCTQVDKNGEVRITMKKGGHGLSVNGENMYISTVTGIGVKPKSITPIVDYKLYYKTLDKAYDINENLYSKKAVDGYFAYLGSAYVETKLTDESDVVTATQQIYNVWDDFLNDPESFAKSNDAEGDDDIEDLTPYPKLSDFSFDRGTGTVFLSSPKTSDSASSAQEQSEANGSPFTGDALAIILLIFSIAFIAAGVVLIIYFKKRKNLH